MFGQIHVVQQIRGRCFFKRFSWPEKFSLVPGASPKTLIKKKNMMSTKKSVCAGCRTIPTTLEGWAAKRSFCQESRIKMIQFLNQITTDPKEQARLLESLQ